MGHLTFVSKRLSAVQMCWDHLQQNALNRARGVEKAKVTWQRKNQEKNKITLFLYKRVKFTDVLIFAVSGNTRNDQSPYCCQLLITEYVHLNKRFYAWKNVLHSCFEMPGGWGFDPL